MQLTNVNVFNSFVLEGPTCSDIWLSEINLHIMYIWFIIIRVEDRLMIYLQAHELFTENIS